MEEPASRVVVEEDTTDIEKQPDISEPSAERQAELRLAYEANIAAGKAPYENVKVDTLGEVLWIQRERGWSGDFVRESARGKVIYTDLGGASLEDAELRGVRLFRANLKEATFEAANLRGAYLSGAIMHNTYLGFADLRDADLNFIRVHDSSFECAEMMGAHLQGAELGLMALI